MKMEKRTNTASSAILRGDENVENSILRVVSDVVESRVRGSKRRELLSSGQVRLSNGKCYDITRTCQYWVSLTESWSQDGALCERAVIGEVAKIIKERRCWM